MRLRADQPLRRLPDHDGREQEQQRRFGERGDALDLAVAVLMLLVGRLAGHRAPRNRSSPSPTRSISEWPASDRIASEPVSRPTTALATVSPAEAAIDPSATLSLSFIGSLLPRRVNGRHRGRQCAGFIALPLDFATPRVATRHAIEHAIERNPQACWPPIIVDRQDDMAAVRRCGVSDSPGLNNNRAPFFRHADRRPEALTQHIPSTGNFSFLSVCW